MLMMDAKFTRINKNDNDGFKSTRINENANVGGQVY